jgi:hypothetical protein
MNPVPAYGLQGSWSYSKDDAWLVGLAGLIVRWTSGVWSSVESGTTADLRAVWGWDSRDAWAVGDGGTIVRWDGLRWSVVSSPVSADLNSVFGSAADDVWAVGKQGTFVHWDGAVWASVAAASAAGASMTGLWAASRTQVWAVGDAGILQWDGVAWTKVEGFAMWGIWGANANDVWAVGQSDSWEYPVGRTSHAHWDGKTWTFVPEPKTDWPSFTSADSLFTVWGTGRGDVWATTNTAANSLAHFDGTTWSSVPFTDNPTVLSNAHLGGGVGNAVFATSNVGIGQFDGTGWVLRSNGILGSFSGIWMNSPADGWAITGNSVAHWNGSAWSIAATPTPSTYLYAIHGTADNDVWAVGYGGVVIHWDGATWTSTKIDGVTYVQSVWASNPRDVWVTASEQGAESKVLHYDGAAWTVAMVSMGDRVGSVWGAAANDVWVAADSGNVLHWDGAVWTTTEASVRFLGQISGSSSHDVWLPGYAQDGGKIVHWDGTSWTSSPGSEKLGHMVSLAAVAPNDVWAVGYDGAVGHWDGTGWTPIAVGFSSDLEAVFAFADGTVWVGGIASTILRRSP